MSELECAAVSTTTGQQQQELAAFPGIYNYGYSQSPGDSYRFPSFPRTGQPLITDPSHPLNLQEPCCFFCYTGVGGLRMPGHMVTAWRIGLKRIMSTGQIGKWPRYIFLAIQSLLLLIAIVVSIFAPFDSEAARYWRIGFLAFALAVNFVERVLFWCLHTLGKLRDDGSWNFRADIVRLFITEALIYVALLITLITTSTYRTQYSDIDNFSHAYAVLGILGFLYFLTAFVMQIFIVIKFTHSLLKARVANISNAATSQEVVLCGLCVYTCALCALKAVLVLLIYFSLQDDKLFTFVYTFTICGFFPVVLWCLYLL